MDEIFAWFVIKYENIWGLKLKAIILNIKSLKIYLTFNMYSFLQVLQISGVFILIGGKRIFFSIQNTYLYKNFIKNSIL